jgi:hypothetical protein
MRTASPPPDAHSIFRRLLARLAIFWRVLIIALLADAFDGTVAYVGEA